MKEKNTVRNIRTPLYKSHLHYYVVMLAAFSAPSSGFRIVSICFFYGTYILRGTSTYTYMRCNGCSTKRACKPAEYMRYIGNQAYIIRTISLHRYPRTTYVLVFTFVRTRGFILLFYCLIRWSDDMSFVVFIPSRRPSSLPDISPWSKFLPNGMVFHPLHQSTDWA